MTNYEPLFLKLLPSVFEAGKAIMKIYHEAFSVEKKSDDSPVTMADRLGEDILTSALTSEVPDIPVVAEEAASEGRIPNIEDRFILLDPLDGTKEFINKRQDFTINIGLIENGSPSFGIVYAPAAGDLYYTLSPQDAYSAKLNTSQNSCELQEIRRISTRHASQEGLVVVASRSHMNEETEAFLEDHKILALKNAGSSLKFCTLACGEADLYPRLGPTMEWDTAAGHAVLSAAGGGVFNLDGTPLKYGKASEKFRNPHFVAWGRPPQN